MQTMQIRKTSVSRASVADKAVLTGEKIFPVWYGEVC